MTGDSMDEMTMQPGQELDALVARVIGWISWTGETPAYSTDPAAAMEAWGWLEENMPESWGVPLALTRDYYSNAPSVVFRRKGVDMVISGETYSHAIALAVVKAGKEMEKNEG